MTTIEPRLTPPPPPGPSLGRTAPPPQPLLRPRLEALAVTPFEFVGVLVVGLAGNYALRTGLASVAGAVTVLAIGALLLLSGRIERREARVIVVAAMTLAPWLALRASAGLTLVTILAIGGLFAVAAGYSRRGRLVGAGAIELVAHAGAHVFEWIYGLGMVRRFVRSRGRVEQFIPMLRGVLVAIPVVGVFALLLASADDVFRSVISVNLLPTVIGHVMVALFVSVGVLSLLSRTAHETEPTNARLGRVLSPVEVKVILGSVAVLFAAFVATQVAVALGGADHVLETAGLTQAEHARRGFFQLLWVAALTLTLIGGVRALRITAPSPDAEPTSPDRFRVLALAILALTLVITVISIQRLALYVDAFGLTPLRFWSLATAGWIGLLVVVYGVAIADGRAGSGRDGELGPGVPRSWFPAAVVVSAAVFVFALNLANPDAFVTSYNLEHSGVAIDEDAERGFAPAARQTGSNGVDLVELGRLSADNIRTIESALPALDSADRSQLTRLVCDRFRSSRRYGALGWNWAKDAERAFFDEHCSTGRD